MPNTTSSNKEQSTNLQQIRKLVDVLEANHSSDDGYTNTLSDIQRVIDNEQEIISNLKQPKAKIRHYESICATIIGILSKVSI
jgi:hypothetical protein